MSQMDMRNLPEISVDERNTPSSAIRKKQSSLLEET